MSENINCSAANKKMCEEPCLTCGKCWSKKVCTGCSRSRNRSKCRYNQDDIRKQQESRFNKKYTLIAIFAIIVIITLIATFCVTLESFFYAFANPELTMTQLTIRSFGKYWFIYILLFIEIVIISCNTK